MANTRGDRTKDHKGSGWKWAFLILLLINIGIVVWGVVQLNLFSDSEGVQPVGEEVAVSDEAMAFELLTDKEQVTRIANLYLQEELDERFSGYTVTVDEQVVLEGALNVFGFDVDFGMYMDPLVMDNGNLQLRTQSIQLGDFELPTSIALTILRQQLDLPEWIRIDSDEAVIFVAFNEFSTANDLSLRMKRIDLEADDIRLDIILPEGAL